MEIRRNPPRELLEELQGVLDSCAYEGIRDIWVAMDPFYIAAVEDENIVGVASISLGTESAELYKLYVSPLYRGQGIGELLFHETLKILRERKIDELFIEIAGDSHQFWRKMVTPYEGKKYTDSNFSIKI